MSSTPNSIMAANADHMSDRARMFAFLVMAFGMFMALIDIQIVTSSLSEIQAGLGATSDEVSAIQTSYLVAEVIMIPLSGWLSKLMSTRWLFTASAVGFTVASAACAGAWNIESMVVFRAIQGFIGGAMIPTVFATGFVLFTGAKQERIPAILGLVATLAPTLGPTLGGFITENLSWRWLFLINIVPGTFISLLVPVLVKIDKPNPQLIKKFDVVGAFLLALFLGTFQYVLDQGARNDWLSDNLLMTLAVISAVSFIAFIWRAMTGSSPIVDLHAFKHRNFLVGCLLSLAIGVTLYGMVYLPPLFLGLIRGFDAMQVGATVWVVGLSMILATPVAVLLQRKFDVRVVLAIGCSLVILSTYQFSHINSDWGFREMFWPQMFRGAGMMFCIITVTGVALRELSPDELKGASGLYNLMRNLGGAIGLAYLNTELFYDRFALHFDRLAASINSNNHAATEMFAIAARRFHEVTTSAGDTIEAVRMYTAQLVVKQALTASFADVFYLLMVLFSLALLIVPFVRDVRTSPTAGSTGE